MTEIKSRCNEVFQKMWLHRSGVLLCVLMWLNLFYMHHNVYISHYGYAETDGFTPLFSMGYDVFVSLLFFEIITFGKRKIAYTLTYVFLFFFVVINIVYSRFMGQYLPLYALGETDNFHGTWWMDYINGAFKWKDILLVITTALSIFIIRKLPNERSWKASIEVFGVLLVLFFFHIYKGSRHDQVSIRSYSEIKEWKWAPLQFVENCGASVYTPRVTIFNYGIVEGQLIFGIIKNSSAVQLDQSEIQDVKKFISERKEDVFVTTDSCRVQGRPNIVMIVMESGLSCAVDEIISGRYVMPRLQELIQGENAYYNPKMKSNRGAGQSSDAQISYFTGLMPTKGEASILYVLRDSVVALPSIFATKGYTTCITIPNNEDFWHQKELNTKYGFTQAYALGTEENKFWCQDKDIFKNVVNEQKQLKSPFFHCVLTLSMHSPYQGNPDFIRGRKAFKFPLSYSQEYCNYLEKCNYTDEQIGKYIDYLKDVGVFANTIITVVSDHEPPFEAIEESPKLLSSELYLPLLIINSGIDSKKFSNKTCNQVDLFPTLLDMLGVESQWRGVGRSLLRQYETYELSEREERISAYILRGNYFGKK